MTLAPGGNRGGRTIRVRIALAVSVAVVLAYWVGSTAWVLLRPGGPTVPPSVAWLALYVCVRTAVVVAVVWPLLRASGELPTDLGLTLPALRRALLPGLLLGVGLFLLHIVLGSLLAAVIGGHGMAPAVAALFRDPREAPLWVFAAVVGGGFSEELVRAFVLTRFRCVLGRAGLVVALIVDSFVFGVGHLYQGTGPAVMTGVIGLLFGLIYLYRGRVVDAMVTHAVFDLLGVAAAYALYGSWG
jgi:uncharacterized protein